MYPAIPLLIGAFVGIDVGWTDVPEKPGQREYIIQIEPGVIDRLKAGEAITSMIDPAAGGFTQIRLQVGSGPLPRQITTEVYEPEAKPNTNTTTGPPLPSKAVLEIVTSPEPAIVNIDLPLSDPGNSLLDEDAPSTISEDRESGFTIPGELAVGEEDLLLLDKEDGVELELSFGEIEATAVLVYDNEPKEPGGFASSSVKNEATLSPGEWEPRPEEESPAARELEEAVAPASYAKPVAGDVETKVSVASKPWVPLIMTVLGLIASLGGNIYLAIMFVGLYRRHRRLSNEHGEENGEMASP